MYSSNMVCSIAYISSKKTVQTEKIPKEELEIKLHLDDEVFVVKEKSSEQLLDTMKNYIKKIHQRSEGVV